MEGGGRKYTFFFPLPKSSRMLYLKKYIINYIEHKEKKTSLNKREAEEGGFAAKFFSLSFLTPENGFISGSVHENIRTFYY